MSFDPSLEDLLFETVTIEPFSSYSNAQQTPAYGTSVTYLAQVLPFTQRQVDRQGKEFVSTARVVIPQRVAVDVRDRITLPSGFTPQQPPIRLVRPIKGLDLDHTEIVCG